MPKVPVVIVDASKKERKRRRPAGGVASDGRRSHTPVYEMCDVTEVMENHTLDALAPESLSLHRQYLQVEHPQSPPSTPSGTTDTPTALPTPFNSTLYKAWFSCY